MSLGHARAAAAIAATTAYAFAYSFANLPSCTMHVL